MTGTEYVERGAAIQLVCNASGRPEPPYNVDWYKVGWFNIMLELRHTVNTIIIKSSQADTFYNSIPTSIIRPMTVRSYLYVIWCSYTVKLL